MCSYRMTTPKSLLALPLIFLLTVAFMGPSGGLGAQEAPPGEGVQPATGRPKITTRKPGPGQKPAALAKPDASKAAPAGAAASPAAAPSAPAPEKGLLARILSLGDVVARNAVWVVAALGVGLAVFIYFALRGQRGEASAELGPRRSARKDEAPRPAGEAALARPSAAAGDREYALVVDEADLKMPPLPEESTQKRRKVDTAPIQALLEKRNFDAAYAEYQKEIETDGGSEFAPDVERRLGEHFLRGGDLKKAARILEHHVATHAGDQILPETYFDLGYIHFKAKTLAKSRRYLRLFVERHADPQLVERARRILHRLDRVHNLN